jgi:hypothetical protein
MFQPEAGNFDIQKPVKKNMVPRKVTTNQYGL